MKVKRLIVLFVLVTLIFPSSLLGFIKPALIRLEDVNPEYAIQENGLEVLRLVADYLYSQNVPFQISVIPVYSDPLENIYLDMSADDPNMQKFRETIKYMQSKGGTVGIHGYTHQFANSVTGRGYEFGNNAYSEDAIAFERMEKAVQIFYKAGIDNFYYWETPHYAATDSQYKKFANRFSVFYEPDYKQRGARNVKVYYNLKPYQQPTVFIPAPLDFASNNDDVERIISEVKQNPPIVSFFFHPAAEFKIDYTSNGKRRGFFLDNRTGYLEKIVEEIKRNGYSFISLKSYVETLIPPTKLIMKIGNEVFTVNESKYRFTSTPVIKNNRTLVPIRAIMEALGGTVGWDSIERKVTVLLDSTTIELWIGKNIAKVNDIDIPIDPNNYKVVPEIINSRTIVPVRFVAENLGAKVDWDGPTQTITIIYNRGG